MSFASTSSRREEVGDRQGGAHPALSEKGVGARSVSRVGQDRLEHRQALQGGRRADLFDLLTRAEVFDVVPPAPALHVLDPTVRIRLEDRHERIAGIARLPLKQALGPERPAAAALHQMPDGARRLGLAGRPAKKPQQSIPAEVSVHLNPSIQL
jgi:hypothetical protein